MLSNPISGSHTFSTIPKCLSLHLPRQRHPVAFFAGFTFGACRALLCNLGVTVSQVILSESLRWLAIVLTKLLSNLYGYIKCAYIFIFVYCISQTTRYQQNLYDKLYKPCRFECAPPDIPWHILIKQAEFLVLIWHPRYTQGRHLKDQSFWL